MKTFRIIVKSYNEAENQSVMFIGKVHFMFSTALNHSFLSRFQWSC